MTRNPSPYYRDLQATHGEIRDWESEKQRQELRLSRSQLRCSDHQQTIYEERQRARRPQRLRPR